MLIENFKFLFYPSKSKQKSPQRKNYAAANAGASILDKSKFITNPKSILTESPDDYMFVPACNFENEVYLIINLAEDVLIDSIEVSNLEDFSENFD